MRVSVIFCSVVVVVLLSACTGPRESVPADQQVGVFQEAPCPTALPEGLQEGQDVICGYVVVPEYHAKPEDGTLRLAVAKVVSLSENPSADPLVPLPTGPGSSAFDAFLPLMASEIGSALRAKRDAVIFEQRGLYYSEPNLVCDGPQAWFLDRLDEDVRGRENVRRTAEAYEACRESLTSRGVRLEAFKYTESAADLGMIMDALGYDKFNVIGVSAGTMLAQRLLQTQSDRLRSVTFSSAAGVDRPLQAAWPALSARNLRRLFESCAADPDCKKAYPDLGAKLERILNRLNETPVTVEVDDPRLGGRSQLVINGDRFAEAIFVMTYLTNLLPVVPDLIHSVDAGHDERLVETLQVLAGPGDRFSWALGYSIFCSETSAFTEADITFEGLYPTFEEAVANTPWGPRAVLAVCNIWGVERLGSEINELPESEVPTLFISGEFDSITPPSSASALAKSLGNALEYTIPGAAHSAIESGPCSLSLALQFLDDPTTEPEASCVSDLGIEFKVADGQ